MRWIVVLIRPRPGTGIPLPFRPDPRDPQGRSPLERLWGETLRHVPSARTVAAVLEPDRPWWTQAIRNIPAPNLVEEPFDRGTGTGLLVALGRLAQRDPEGQVVVLHSRQLLDPRPLPARCFDPMDRPDPESLRPGVCRGSVAGWLHRFQMSQPELSRIFFDQVGASCNLWRLHETYSFLPSVSLERDVLRHEARVGRNPLPSKRTHPSHTPAVPVHPGLPRSVEQALECPRATREPCLRRLSGQAPGKAWA